MVLYVKSIWATAKVAVVSQDTQNLQLGSVPEGLGHNLTEFPAAIRTLA